MTRRLRNLRAQISGADFIRAGAVPKSMQICHSSACIDCAKMESAGQQFRIIFLSPAYDRPAGGIKVIYRQSEILSANGIESGVFHPGDPDFRCSWFHHQATLLKLGHFNTRRDFLVFPELWAGLAAKFCIPSGIRYAIYAQNGYLATSRFGFSREDLNLAYERADLVLSISADTTNIILLAFPQVQTERILRIFHSVPSIFSPGHKRRLISFMPRKLPDHADRVRHYLDGRMPEGWELQPITGLDETGVAEMLAASSIFLSFSDHEGCPLPPIEAALAGNIVVGYTGQGAKEYFRRPIFREVANGDYVSFVGQIRQAILDVENGLTATDDFAGQQHQLSQTHSLQNETEHVLQFADRARKIMANDRGWSECGPSSSD
ncbi:MAG: hypothetical protein AB9M53_08140 [Leptothrix sp. (in: b-proteobacteria)]